MVHYPGVKTQPIGTARRSIHLKSFFKTIDQLLLNENWTLTGIL